MTVHQITATEYKVDSHTAKGIQYRVLLHSEGATCECKGYGYRGTCSHIDEVMQENPATLAMALYNETPTNSPSIPKCRQCGTPIPPTHTASGLCAMCFRASTLHPEPVIDGTVDAVLTDTDGNVRIIKSLRRT